MKILITVAPILYLLFFNTNAKAQQTRNASLAATPPMSWMSWNYYADHINENAVKKMADAMVKNGMVSAGYRYIIIDDGWQGGRDNKNNIIPDQNKFPSGIKALADYCHQHDIKLGIYSDAAQLTCAGYTASDGFEEQDAKTFADWGIDYLKYDYCNAPEDSATAKIRYKKMAEALTRSGRDIVFSICEWGNRQPWNWAVNAGGQLWRTTADIRDKWQSKTPPQTPNDLHHLGAGIMDVVDINTELYLYAGKGRWNDPDMLNVGLYGKKGPSGDLGGVGCSDVEYQSQFSLWCMMSSPLTVSCNIDSMNEATRKILLNKNMIAVDQDSLGKQAIRKVKDSVWNVFVKPLANGDYAIAVLNRSDKTLSYKTDFSSLDIDGNYIIKDLWSGTEIKNGKGWKGSVASHETKVFRLTKNNKQNL